jgi:hypothetical protein
MTEINSAARLDFTDPAVQAEIAAVAELIAGPSKHRPHMSALFVSDFNTPDEDVVIIAELVNARVREMNPQWQVRPAHEDAFMSRTRSFAFGLIAYKHDTEAPAFDPTFVEDFAVPGYRLEFIMNYEVQVAPDHNTVTLSDKAIEELNSIAEEIVTTDPQVSVTLSTEHLPVNGTEKLDIEALGAGLAAILHRKVTERNSKFNVCPASVSAIGVPLIDDLAFAMVVKHVADYEYFDARPVTELVSTPYTLVQISSTGTTVISRVNVN